METTIAEVRDEPYDLGRCLFIGSVHLMIPLGIILWFMDIVHCSWRSVALALIWFEFSCTSVTAGYHRLFAHPTYDATLPLKIFYLIWAAATFQGSVFEWASKHRAHHKYVDTDLDPYNINRGFWYAHIGWMLRKTHSDFSLIPDLVKDRLIFWQHRLDLPSALVMTFILPALIGGLWDEALGALFLTGFLRLVIQWHMTFCVNSVAHYFGKRDDPKSTARGSWLTGFFTQGEGDSHGYHHRHPGDYRVGIHWYNLDFAKWFIWTCSKMGLASNLRRVRLAND
ncbi:MAG: acyl-CoA desaturase [Patescibacteria group bacterium]